MGEIHEEGNDIEAQREISRGGNHASPTGGIAQIEVGLAADFMKKRLAELPGKPSEPRSVTIFHLPGWFHEINKELCEPKLVAICPYHHNKKGLRTMEEHKWYTLRDFLARNKNVGLEVYLQVMKSIEEQARHCYSDTVDMESDDFVMMLLLDGCFILQWLFKRDLYEDDAICEVGWAGDYILSDMCLFENQLPFFVIHKLLETRDQSVGWSQNCEDHCPLLKLTIKGLDGHFRIDKFRLPGQISCRDIDHWLHLYYIGVVFNFQPEAQREPGNPVNGKSHNFFGLGSFPWSKLFFKPRKGISDCSEPSDANL